MFSQYSPTDRQLVLTTFTRSFDKNIVLPYLKSDDAEKVNAALLSVAQSGDTLFVPDVKRVDFKRHNKYVCFALSELGACYSSSQYLRRMLSGANLSEDVSCECLSALGSTGDRNDFDWLRDEYNSRGKNQEGISIAVYNFYSRKIISKDDAHKLILPELLSSQYFSKKNFDAAFALYRTGGSDSARDFLLEELNFSFRNPAANGKFKEPALQYVIGSLRQIKYFPDNNDLFNNLINIKSFPLKIEAAKYLSLFHYKSEKKISSYLSLLNSQNANVARQAAASLRNFRTAGKLLTYLKHSADSLLLKANLSYHVEGELFLSYIKLFAPSFGDILAKYGNNVPAEYFFQACGIYAKDKTASNYLIEKYSNATPNKKLQILENLLPFQKNFPNDKNLWKVLENALSSDSPALISTCADGLDSVLTSRKNLELASIIKKQTEKYKDNSTYLESLQSLLNLSDKLPGQISSEIISLLKHSRIYAVKKAAFVKSGVNLPEVKKDTSGFGSFWHYAFEYKKAKILTESGFFIIKLLPGAAPVSVGNFVSLAVRGFFNGLKFHRVVPGFVIQGGDPEGNGWGGPGYDIVSEFSPLNYSAGMVGMASAGKDTEGSQWFVTTGSFPHLDGRYTIFGKVIKGMKTVDETLQGEKILKVIPEK